MVILMFEGSTPKVVASSRFASGIVREGGRRRDHGDEALSGRFNAKVRLFSVYRSTEEAWIGQTSSCPCVGYRIFLIFIEERHPDSASGTDLVTGRQQCRVRVCGTDDTGFVHARGQ
jgi:hypothetical protein